MYGRPSVMGCDIMHYGRTSVTECEYYAYVSRATCYSEGGRWGAWMQLNQKQYIIKGMTHGTGLHLVIL